MKKYTKNLKKKITKYYLLVYNNVKNENKIVMIKTRFVIIYHIIKISI